MKKNLVIIAGTCYPIASATGSLALKCAKYLKNEYDVSIISIRKNEERTLKKVDVDGVTIYMLGRFRLDWLYKHKKLASMSRGFKKSLMNASVFLARLCGKIDSSFFHMDNMWWFKKAAYKQLEYLGKEKKIDTIISFCLPIESHLAAMKYRKLHRDTLWASYWADDFAVKRNKKNLFYSMASMRRLERDLLCKSDVVISAEELTESLHSYRAVETIYSVPYVIDQSILYRSCKQKAGGHITGVFMGNLYKEIRNPEYMLKVFSDSELKDVTLQMYIGGNCDHIVEKYATKSSNIRFHGFIAKDRLDLVLQEADFLINIDNLNCIGKPSKLYELISYRKPILNFGHSDDCGDLERYPCKLHIPANLDTHTAAVEIKKYLFDSKERTEVTPEHVEMLYQSHTEQYVRNLITEALKDTKNGRKHET